MNDPNSIAAALLSRRFAAIILCLIAVITAYGLLWRDAGERLAQRVDHLAEILPGQDMALTIGQKQLRGFPYRLELHLSDITLSHHQRAYHLDDLVLYASPLSLDHLVIDSGDRSGGRDAPFVMRLPEGAFKAKDARASLVGQGADLRIAVDIKSARFQRDGADEPIWLASRLQYHSRPNPQALARDHVVRIDGLNPAQGLGPQTDLFEVYATRRPDGATEITAGTWAAEGNTRKITGSFAVDGSAAIKGAVEIQPSGAAAIPFALDSPSDWQNDLLKLMVLP